MILHMFSRRGMLTASLVSLISALVGRVEQAKSDPLPSWNEGAVKKSLTDFVTRVTSQGGSDFLPVPERPLHSTMTAACGRAASLFPTVVRRRPDEGTRPTAPRKGIAELVMATHA